MKGGPKFLFITAAVMAALTLFSMVIFGSSWNSLIALIIGGGASLITLAVGLLMGFINAVAPKARALQRSGITLLILSGADWLYLTTYNEDTRFFIPYLPQIFAWASLLLGLTLTIIGTSKSTK